MIIDKLQAFYTDTEKQKIKEYQQRLTSLLEQAEENNQDIDTINNKLNDIYKNIRQRYMDSFQDNPNAIYDDIKEILQALEKIDYIRYKAEYLTKYNIKKTMDYMDELLFIQSTLKDQIITIDFYKIDAQELFKLIEEKATKLFSPIKKEISSGEVLKSYSNLYFDTIRQGCSTNTLTKLKPTNYNTTIETYTGNATITKGDFSLKILNYTKLKGLKISTYQLLDAITTILTESGAKSPMVTFSLSDYMERRQLKDRKEAKNQVIADLDILLGVRIYGKEKQGKDIVSYSSLNIADTWKVKRNGDIEFTFGATFFNMLLNYPIMPYPKQLQTINTKNNPNSFYLLRKISEHKNMNMGKNNEDIISVKTLLDATPSIPSYEQVINEDRAITRKIINPFERDMNNLKDTLQWSYCQNNGKKLTTKELLKMNYDTFINLLIKTEWKNYPKRKAKKIGG